MRHLLTIPVNSRSGSCVRKPLESFPLQRLTLTPIDYFGVNLDKRFSVPDFWPKPEQSHRIPFERDEIYKEIARLRDRRLAARAKRFEVEELEEST